MEQEKTNLKKLSENKNNDKTSVKENQILKYAMPIAIIFGFMLISFAYIYVENAKIISIEKQQTMKVKYEKEKQAKIDLDIEKGKLARIDCATSAFAAAESLRDIECKNGVSYQCDLKRDGLVTRTVNEAEMKECLQRNGLQ